MKYATKIRSVDAIQFTRENIDEVKEFLGDRFVKVETERCPNGVCVLTYKHCSVRHDGMKDSIKYAVPGDYIAKADNGAVFSMSEKCFLRTWDPVEERADQDVSDMSDDVAMDALARAFSGEDDCVFGGG